MATILHTMDSVSWLARNRNRQLLCHSVVPCLHLQVKTNNHTYRPEWEENTSEVNSFWPSILNSLNMSAAHKSQVPNLKTKFTQLNTDLITNTHTHSSQRNQMMIQGGVLGDNIEKNAQSIKFCWDEQTNTATIPFCYKKKSYLSIYLFIKV